MKLFRFRTKVEFVCSIFVVAILLTATVFSVRIITDTNDNIATFITNSNGGVWDATDDDLQLAINNLNNASGTVYLGGDITTDRIIQLWNNTILDLCGYTITLDIGFSNANSHGAIEIGNSGELSRNNTVCNGVIVGNNYTSYPTSSGNNANIYGIYSVAVMQNCTIQNMRFNNLFGSILLEGLGKINGNPGRGINIKDIWMKNLYVGIQTYSNGYEYYDVLVSGVHAENIEDDVVAIVGHWGSVAGATPIVRNVIVQNIQVSDKNTLEGGAVVKLDAGDATGGDIGKMSDIIVDNIDAYTSAISLGESISVVTLLKGQNTERLFFSDIIGRGEWTYGIQLYGKMANYYIDGFALNARYGIFLHSTQCPSNNIVQCVRINNGYLAPITSRADAYSVYGMGIVLAAGNVAQGIENLQVDKVHTMWLEYPIYEGDAPHDGVQGTYQNISYNLDVGNQNYSNLSISSDPVDLDIYKRGMQIYSNFNRFGNTTDYMNVNETGYLTLHGNARTLNDLWIDAGGIKAPGLKPAAAIAHGTLETPAWEFGNEDVAGNQESVSWSMRLPNRMDRTVAPTIDVGWSANGVSPGVCEWQLEYLWTSVDEDTTAGAQETLTVNGTASSTSNGLILSSFMGIDIPNATDACIHCKLTRLSAGTNDTIAVTVEMHGICFGFTSDKTGSAIG